MGWNRSGDINLFIDNEILPISQKTRITDISTGKEVPAQMVSKRAEGAYWVLEVKDIPALGYKALKIESGETQTKADSNTNETVLENRFYKVVINKSTGAVSSLYDKELNQELADGQNLYNIGQPVKETTK